VPNHDDGEDLGVFQADCLPRVGEQFAVYHPRICDGSDPFVGTVGEVCWQAMHASHEFANTLEGENIAAALLQLHVRSA